jgi:hypothetical protein
MAARDEAGHGLASVFAHARQSLRPRLDDPGQRAWWDGLSWMVAATSSLPNPPIPAAAALPPFAALCRRLDPLPLEPVAMGVETGDIPHAAGLAAPLGGRP